MTFRGHAPKVFLTRQGASLKRSRRRLVGVAFLAAAVLVGSQPAIASAGAARGAADAPATVGEPGRQLTADEEAQLRSFFDEYDVADADQDALLAAYESGGRWLSMTAGAEPVDVRTEDKDGMRSTVSTFADGSVAVSGTSLPQDPVRQDPVRLASVTAPSSVFAPSSVTGCRTSGSTRVITYTNCLAKVDNGLVMMSFRFTWRLYVGSSASITSYSPNSRDHRCLGCIMSDHRVFRVSRTNVRYSATIGLPPGEYLGWMGVRVGTGGASTYQGP